MKSRPKLEGMTVTIPGGANNMCLAAGMDGWNLVLECRALPCSMPGSITFPSSDGTAVHTPVKNREKGGRHPPCFLLPFKRIPPL